jgi:hypothetical protein
LDRSLDRAALRFSEKNGELRVVTVADGQFGAFGRNRLSILKPSSIGTQLLKTISVLPNSSQPTPLGKPGEQLFATRFIDDRLYAVTYHVPMRVDPLYVVNLSDSANPKITGSLEMPGFSDYLHPLGSNMLLGVGRTDDGNMQVSLFDVSNDAAPTRVGLDVLGGLGSTSAIFSSHLAFSYYSLGDGRAKIAFPLAFSATPQNRPGLYQWDVQTGTSPLLSRGAPLETVTASSAENSAAFSAAAGSGRGLYLRDIQVYLENGRLWYQKSGQSFGPF